MGPADTTQYLLRRDGQIEAAISDGVKRNLLDGSEKIVGLKHHPV